VIGTDQGYAIVDDVFERTEMVGLIETLGRSAFARTPAGARHLLKVPEIGALAHEPRLVHIASKFVGASPCAFRATLFDKSVDANWRVAWHQDTALPLTARVEAAHWGPWSVKSDVLYAHAPAAALDTMIALRVHLDDSTRHNGPLRVLPRTHERGVLSDDEIERLARTVTPVECLTSAGGVVAMRPLIVHASSKIRDGQPRRVLHIEYARSLTMGPGLDLAVC
jgi:ectoine hydroxylase-related dioxygenase (phytanoyl-CoA dioxygenase family)